MKKKIAVTIAVIAVSVATVKSGYAFYENQTKNQAENQTSGTQVTKNGGEAQKGVIGTELWETEENTNETGNSYNSGNCCGSSLVNMLDDNGNLKDRETFGNELDEAVQKGDITKEDQEYYLFMYEKCADALSGSASGPANGSDADSYGAQGGTADGSQGYYPPSCH